MRRPFLAGVLAVILGCSGLFAAPAALAPAAPPALAVNWPVFLAKQDLVWQEYPNKWEEAPFIGNGALGAFIRQEQGGGLSWEVNRTDIVHDGLRYVLGHLAVQVNGGFVAGGETRLDLWNAEVRGAMRTPRSLLHWRSFAVASPSVIVVELTGLKVEPGTEVVWLSSLARPPRAGKRSDAYPPDALNPPPEVETVVDGVNTTQTFNNKGGAFAVVLRRIYSSLDRKVYVLSVDRGDSAKRALSEAQLSAERAASIGLDGLVAAQRSWWHQFYPASFLSLPDARLEAFYWIQMYKLGSALRAGGPVLDAIGPWYRGSPPATEPNTGFNPGAAAAYAPIFTANRLALGESVFSIDPKANQPAEAWALISQLAWQDYRFTMDDGVLARRAIPLLLRAIDAPKADPAFVRWALQTLVRVSDRPKTPDARVVQWKERLAALPPLPAGAHVIPFPRPDRPNERRWIEGAIRSRETKGAPAPAKDGTKPAIPRGRGLGEAAALRALLGQGGPALDDLNLLLGHFLKPNTFFTEGTPQLGPPLAAAGAVQDLLFQSWGNKLRFFPALPPAWKNASFSTLRGEGGFLASGVWQDGAAVWIRVESTAPVPCRVIVPGWTGAVVRSSRGPEVTVRPGDVPGEFVLNLGKGGWVILSPSADAPLPPLVPVSSPEGSATHSYPFHPAL